MKATQIVAQIRHLSVVSKYTYLLYYLPLSVLAQRQTAYGRCWRRQPGLRCPESRRLRACTARSSGRSAGSRRRCAAARFAARPQSAHRPRAAPAGSLRALPAQPRGRRPGGGKGGGTAVIGGGAQAEAPALQCGAPSGRSSGAHGAAVRRCRRAQVRGRPEPWEVGRKGVGRKGVGRISVAARRPRVCPARRQRARRPSSRRSARRGRRARRRARAACGACGCAGSARARPRQAASRARAGRSGRGAAARHPPGRACWWRRPRAPPAPRRQQLRGGRERQPAHPVSCTCAHAHMRTCTCMTCV